MGSTPVCTIDATGIHKPAFADVLTYFQSQYQGIYGSDVYLGNDSQDGQLLALFATAVDDCNAQTVAAYNSFSPSTAQGVGLSRVVKINGIQRDVATYSTDDLTIIGVAGTTIAGGIASDGTNDWALPAIVMIPYSGSIIVTATCATIGAVQALSGTINAIGTPTRGWQSVNNAVDATPGAPVETDAQLRVRQTVSTALPSLTILDGIVGAVANVSGVQRYQAYENDTNADDVNGIPGHSIAIVVQGGDAQAIANAIATKKTPGAGTYGTTTEIVTDAYGIPHAINFFRPSPASISWGLTVRALPGFTTTIQAKVAQALSDWTNALAIGQDVFLSRAYLPANLFGAADSLTYEITALTVCRTGGTLAAADAIVDFEEIATCDPSQVTFTVTS